MFFWSKPSVLQYVWGHWVLVCGNTLYNIVYIKSLKSVKEFHTRKITFFGITDIIFPVFSREIFLQ